MMWLVLALLTLLAAGFVIYPLIKKPAPSALDRSDNSHLDASKETSGLVKQANVVLYKEQLAELDQQLADGEIDQQQHAEIVAEQQRLLLVDSPAEPLSAESSVAETGKGHRGAWLLMLCLLLVPLLSFGLYQMIGASDDVEISELLQRANTPMSSDEQAALSQTIQKKIARRLISDPDNDFYRVTLARMQMEDGNFAAASSSYQQVVNSNPSDPDLLAEYAQALYFLAGNKFDGEAGLVLDNALAVDPNNRTALGLKGIRAFESGDYRLAMNSWQTALNAIPPGSPQAQALQSGILRARKELGEALPALNVEVSISENITPDSGLMVYVFAREWQGKPMPLAVAKLSVDELPATVTLDDSMAMMGGQQLSSVDIVEVVARVSMTGSAIPSEGDYQGSSGALKMTDSSQVIQLVIDHQL